MPKRWHLPAMNGSLKFGCPLQHAAPFILLAFFLHCAVGEMQFTERPPGYGGVDFETAAREEWMAMGAVDEIELNSPQRDMVVQFHLQPRNLPKLQQVIDAVSEPRYNAIMPSTRHGRLRRR